MGGLTESDTFDSITRWRESLSRNTSLPCVSPLFKDVPVTTILSSGLKQQSVLQK